METIKLTITEEHRTKAIASYEQGNFITECCLIAQAIREKLPLAELISVTDCNVYWCYSAHQSISYLDDKGRYIAQLTLAQWKDLELPINVELTKEWW